MISKVDRKAAMRASLSAEKRDVNARFAAADAVLSERPGGLGGVPPPQVVLDEAQAGRTFSAENTGPAQQRIVAAPLDRVHENALDARHI